MQLLLRRRIVHRGLYPKFALWAKFDVNTEEERLIMAYNARGGYITIEASRRDMWRGAVLGFLAACILVPIILSVVRINTRFDVLSLSALFVAVWGLCGWLIYEQLRFAIRLSDMLNGREFKHKSLVLMARRERAMIGYGYAFIQLLEKMQNWEGTETIQIGQEHEGALRLVTDVYAPS